MKLNDVYTKPLKDVVEELNLTDMKVHTDDDGEVRSIEQTGRMRIKHCMNGTTWTAHVQPWTNTRSRRRRRENNG